MSAPDFAAYGPLSRHFIHRRLLPARAGNSLKLVLRSRRDRGAPYIWIDGPWQLQHRRRLLCSSSPGNAAAQDEVNYTFRHFQWAAALRPLESRRLSGVELNEHGETVFLFEGGYRLRVSGQVQAQQDEEGHPAWYQHWYASLHPRMPQRLPRHR